MGETTNLWCVCLTRIVWSIKHIIDKNKYDILFTNWVTGYVISMR